MSSYEELQQFVAAIASDAKSRVFDLINCADNIEKCAAAFQKLTATTQGNSAKTVEYSFHTAQKQMLLAANALLEAAQVGNEWSGTSEPELKLVLKPRSR